jgi:parvulin-like peptidyl-prolyl isomerase
VRFGVVLVTYAGAEGAPPKARARDTALALATKLAEDAKGDFHAAVARGDDGSADDVGVVTRGVLEPASEAALFGLNAGSTSGVLDTPRGFWIVKRIE